MSTAAQTAGTARDFDFFMGSWKVHNRRLRERLAGSDTWDHGADTRRCGALDPPVFGTFSGDTGFFVGEDVFEGRPILVRFIWSRVTTTTPRWEQAFSDDDGETWETNWVMEFTPEGGQG